MTPSKETLWNIAVHRPRSTGPYAGNRLGPFFKRQQHKYHPARPYRWWEFKPTPPGEAYDISGLEGSVAPVGYLSMSDHEGHQFIDLAGPSE